jgi:photosystem II stability/assembly factor-like uncharacterized protein
MLLFIPILLNSNIISQTNGWFEQQSGTSEYLNACSFVDENLGITVGFNGLILRTTDGGVYWSEVTSNSNENLFEVQMISHDVGWVVGENGTILKTLNGGINWDSQVSSTQEFLSSCSFIDESIGWIVGNNGIVLKTSNGGANWNNVNVGVNNHWNDVNFISSDTGWMVGGLNLLRTEDGGQTWNNIYLNSFDKIIFLDNNIGWGITQGAFFNTSIFRTTDGGYNWDVKLSSTGTSYRAIYFINEAKGWTVGENGLILMTTDAGESWEDQSVSVGNDVLFDVKFTGSEVGWTIGQNGRIFKTINGGVSFIEDKITDQTPTEFFLSQNYPNPFNPSTSIGYRIPNSSFVTLKVYDILGNEVVTLVNKTQAAGNYTISFDASSLSNGVYLYSIKADNFSDVKKMIFMK